MFPVLGLLIVNESQTVNAPSTHGSNGSVVSTANQSAFEKCSKRVPARNRNSRLCQIRFPSLSLKSLPFNWDFRGINSASLQLFESAGRYFQLLLVVWHAMHLSLLAKHDLDSTSWIRRLSSWSAVSGQRLGISWRVSTTWLLASITWIIPSPWSELEGSFLNRFAVIGTISAVAPQ